MDDLLRLAGDDAEAVARALLQATDEWQAALAIYDDSWTPEKLRARAAEILRHQATV